MDPRKSPQHNRQKEMLVKKTSPWKNKKIIFAILSIAVTISIIVTVILVQKSQSEEKDENGNVKVSKKMKKDRKRENIEKLQKLDWKQCGFDMGRLRNNSHLYPSKAIHKNRNFKHEMCLIGSWEGKKLANYHKLSLKTANFHNNSKIKMIFLHEGISDEDTAKYPNVRFVRAPNSIADFTARRMCEFFHMDPQSNCCDTFAEMLKADIVKGEHSPSAQYRATLGFALEDMILNEERCKSWAYIDHDMFYGDVLGFIHNNDKFWDSDVATFGSSTGEAIFAAAQFTVHIQNRRPNFVNGLFSKCPEMSTPQRFSYAFGSGSFYAIDEGCYPSGLYQTQNVTWTHLPFQTSKNTCSCEYILWINGQVFKLNKSELPNVTKIITPSLLSTYNQVKNEEWKSFFHDHTIPAPLRFGDVCMSWVPQIYNICTDFEKTKINNKEWQIESAVVRVKSAQGEYISVPKRNSGFNPHEFAVFHMDDWKKHIDFSKFDDSKPIFLAHLSKEKENILSFDDLSEIERHFKA